MRAKPAPLSREGRAALRGAPSPFPPGGSPNTSTSSPSGKLVMSSPSPNNPAFQGGVITIKTVCKGLPHKNTQARHTWEGLNPGVKRGLSAMGCSPFITPRPAGERSLDRRSEQGCSLTSFQRNPWLSPPPPQAASPLTPELTPTRSNDLWLGFKQECPTAQLQGVPFTENTVHPQNCTTLRFQSYCRQNEGARV